MGLKTFEYDSAEFLDSEEAIAEYLLAASEDGDPQLMARARGMTDLARSTGLGRAALYRALSGEGNPEFATVAKVADALGFKLSFVPKRLEGHDIAAE